MDVGPLEIGLIVVAIVLIFGVGKVGEIGGALGKSIREFRRERDKKEDDVPQTLPAVSNGEVASIQLGTAPATGRVCQSCGNQMSEKAKFCMGCGTRL